MPKVFSDSEDSLKLESFNKKLRNRVLIGRNPVRSNDTEVSVHEYYHERNK